MRPAFLAGLALAVAPAVGLAQTGPYTAVVTDPEVKLRAGASDKFPETGTLRQGSPVVVVKEEENGWLAVQAPPGKLYTISWVQMQFVDFDKNKPTPQDVMTGEEVTLVAGQIGLAQPLLPYRTAKVPAGTALVVVGAKVTFDGKSWYPVVPPEGDYRYLPKQAVKYDRPTTTAFTVRDAIPPTVTPVAASVPGPGPEPGGAKPPAARPAASHPLWARAEAAEREGRLDDAEKLFFQLARVMNESGGDQDTANLCYTRIHTLREKKRGGTATTAVGTTTDTRPSLGGPTRPAPAGPPATGTPPPAPAAASDPTAGPSDDRARWTGPGKLVRSALALDGRKTYSLLSNTGETALYVVAAPGVDLERFLNKKVDVYGVNYQRRDLSKPYVVATAAEPGP